MLVRQTIVGLIVLLAAAHAAAQDRPNILLAIADDWSFGHAERLRRSDRAHAGVRPRRARRRPLHPRIHRVAVVHAVARGAPHRPGAPSAGRGRQPLEHPAAIARRVPRLLEAAGYVVGLTGKGWGPGRFEPGGRDAQPGRAAVRRLRRVPAAASSRPAVLLLVRQHGSASSLRAGHRRHAPSGAAAVSVPPFLPDTPEVRGDLLDYYFEVQRFDRDLGALLGALERIGELEQHDRRRDLRQRHAVPAREGQRLRRRRADAARHSLARSASPRARASTRSSRWPTSRRRCSKRRGSPCRRR